MDNFESFYLTLTTSWWFSISKYFPIIYSFLIIKKSNILSPKLEFRKEEKNINKNHHKSSWLAFKDLSVAPLRKLRRCALGKIIQLFKHHSHTINFREFDKSINEKCISRHGYVANQHSTLSLNYTPMEENSCHCDDDDVGNLKLSVIQSLANKSFPREYAACSKKREARGELLTDD